MSVFTNSASGAKDSAAQYVQAIFDLLGDKEPLEVLQQTPERLAEVIKDTRLETILEPEEPGKWSIGEVIRHLADSELVWGYRIRSVMAEDKPALVGYDQDKWASRLKYSDSDPMDALHLFQALRKTHLQMLAGMTEADLARTAVHVERGEESIALMIKLYAGHDLAHLRQINRILEKFGDKTSA